MEKKEKHTSTKTIKKQIPEFINGMFNIECSLPTKRKIYQMIKNKQIIEPYLFGKSSLESTYGSTRSALSNVCNKKIERELENVHSFSINGVDYFYTDIKQVFAVAARNNFNSDLNIDDKKIRKHCDIQYQLCGIFTKLGLDVWVPNQDSIGDRNKTKYGDKTISEKYLNHFVKQTSKDDFYYIDFVVFDKNNKPILQIEVEETTSVANGLERMSQTKEKHRQIKSFVTSSNKRYQKKFVLLSKGTYSDLSAKFINVKEIENIFNESKMVNQNDENFKMLVNQKFGLNL
jgi:hypothetical protein